MTTQANPASMTDAQKSAYIKKVALQAGEDVRRRHPWLRHQNAIGAAIMIASLTGMIGAAVLYYSGVIAWWVTIPAIAIFASFIHELEHDLIHFMYFRNRPRINSLMLIIGWLVRPSTINPLVRRKLHLHHHKHSGTESDLEERGITNGEPWGVRRLLMTGDNMLAVLLRPVKTYRMVKAFVRAQNPDTEAQAASLRREQRLGYFPVGNFYYLVWHGFLVFSLVALVASLAGQPLALPAWAQSTVAVLNFMAVVVFLPCLLRTFCLHFISSNMHYYGDVEDRNVMQQTQVLNAWRFLPFQLFCFNFGSTHAIHHFAVKETFYIRQWTAPTTHKAMRKMGVRFNDLGTFKRANRFDMNTTQADVVA